MRKALGVALVSAAAMLLTSCGGQESATDQEAVDAMMRDAPEFQRAILEDGDVTRSEYERAMIAERDCVAQAGYSPGPLEPLEGNQDMLGFVTEADYTNSADPEAADEAFLKTTDDCMREYSYLISQAWAGQLFLGEEDLENLRPEVISCLTDAGLELDADATVEEIAEAMAEAGARRDADELEAVIACQDRHYAFFQFEPE